MSRGAGTSPRARREVIGVLLLDKPAGISSNAALQRARARFGAAKAGHTGNLDVEASGLLPLCFGEATKVCGWLLDADKTYDATLRLGVRTTTGDAEGDVVERRSVTAEMRESLAALLPTLLGPRLQVPPMYSALKQGGRPLYALARAGLEVERAPREIKLYALDLISSEGDEARIRVHCSKGTYIRVLAEEIGAALGCGASLVALRRLTAGPFSLLDAVTLDELWARPDPLEAFDARLLPADLALTGLPLLVLGPAQVGSLRHGRNVQLDGSWGAGLFRVYETAGCFVGLVEITPGGLATPRRMFGQVLGMGRQS